MDHGRFPLEPRVTRPAFNVFSHRLQTLLPAVFGMPLCFHEDL
tara:strand:- start:1935 stop:2063 length:129 start_codon:yes stop_codon:yes gene_type:complete